MTGEAAATGRPVYVFTPSAGSDKFRRFHARSAGARRHAAAARHITISCRLGRYEPLQSAETIAREIERRWNARGGIGR